MVFVTLFTRLKNVHLLKDIGMVPYHMYREHGFTSVIVTNRNDREYDYLEKEVKGLRLAFIKGKGAAYLIRHAGRIDVLNVYHLNLQSFFLLWLFKLLKKKGAKSYLKLDIDNDGVRRLLMKNPVGWVKRMTIRAADVVSAETGDIYRRLKKIYGKKLIHITNGYYTTNPEPERFFEKKKEVITVGLLGTKVKATEILIEAFVRAAGDRTDWLLRLVGPVTPDFRNPYPEDGRIVFEGEIKDKEKLRELYRRARIFAFPSRHESFGIVMLEAAACGEYIISTEGVPAAKDIIRTTGYGAIVPVDDTDAFAEELKKAMDTDRDWNAAAETIAERTFERFRWEGILDRLAEKLAE